ncbi:YIP1 family protein [Indiicoccus explosivorum]|uniref:YIP1 family protein n=1 Tax=Indiicoccus explosivorum TaxID=1917864 RepID=UPI001390247A|nr:YIP1 family protein [Indiicoccus explosivorum]
MEGTNYRRDLNPFTAVWLHARETVRYVIEEKSDGFVWILVALAGISGALLGTLDTRTNETFPVIGIVLGTILLGPIAGVIGTAISAAVFLLVGKLFRGKATYPDMFRAVATAQIPNIWLLPFLLIWMLAFPATFFLEPAAETLVSGGEVAWTVFATIVLIVVSVWVFVIQCQSIGEAHRISSWKGFFIVLVTGLAFLALLIAIVVAIAFGAMG